MIFTIFKFSKVSNKKYTFLTRCKHSNIQSIQKGKEYKFDYYIKNTKEESEIFQYLTDKLFKYHGIYMNLNISDNLKTIIHINKLSQKEKHLVFNPPLDINITNNMRKYAKYINLKIVNVSVTKFKNKSNTNILKLSYVGMKISPPSFQKEHVDSYVSGAIPNDKFTTFTKFIHVNKYNTNKNRFQRSLLNITSFMQAYLKQYPSINVCMKFKITKNNTFNILSMREYYTKEFNYHIHHELVIK